MKRENITTPDRIKLPKPLPTRTTYDDPVFDLIYELECRITNVILLVVVSVVITGWASFWSRIYASILRRLF